MDILLISHQQKAYSMLPKNLVKYILPYAPMLPSSLNHRIVVGSLIYENEKIPVLDFATLLTESRNRSPQAKIVIVACINDTSPVNYYAMVADHSPRVVHITEDSIEETDVTVPSLCFSQVVLREAQNKQVVFVPNMERIESEIFTQSDNE